MPQVQGWGHVQRNYPNQRAYIVTTDGSYMRTSDVEDGSDHNDDDDEDAEAFGLEETTTYRSIVVKRVFSTRVEKLDKQQRHNLFHTFFIISNRHAHVIIDSGSSNNLVSSELVNKLCLTIVGVSYAQ
jgi:hypothetical protein